MRTIICKVLAQSEPTQVPSKKAENGLLTKCYIRLQELGGDYVDEYVCAIFGNLAMCKYEKGKTVAAALRFSAHEINGSHFQDVTATEINILN